MKTWTTKIIETGFDTTKLNSLKARYINHHANMAFPLGGSLGRQGAAKLSAKFDAMISAAEFKSALGINRNESII